MTRWIDCVRTWGLAAALATGVTAPAPAETEADVPRDPDFYYVYDDSKEPGVPRPDLSQRPKPRDSRTLTGRDFGPDPQGTLRHFVVGGGASSTCIGEPVTALCAIETFIAAFASRNDSLLNIAEGPFFSGPRFSDKRALAVGQTEFYRVYETKRLQPKDVTGPRPEDVDPWYPRWHYNGEEPWRVGDLQVLVLEMECPSQSSEACFSFYIPFAYTVREIASNRWAVVSIYRARY